MGKPRGFLEVKRAHTQYRLVCERVKDYQDVVKPRSERQSREQASRCMDCGTPFCHAACPLGNYIPEWNDLACHEQWERAFELLDSTNNMPEVTGRVCPALCEYACVLGVNDDPVTVRENELAVIERAFKKGWIVPRPPSSRTGKTVAVVGSGPAGLSCAAQLNRMGHAVTVFERDDKIGGILRYGIPDFKLEKKIIDRRIELWKKEGIKFKTNASVGTDQSADNILKKFDAVCLAVGARVPRDLKIPGRELQGIHFAMDYLVQSNKLVAGHGSRVAGHDIIDAKDKRVVVIGGGDTGSDCVGTANRQGAKCVVQIELLSQPPVCRDGKCPWPGYPMLLKTTSSHEEGAERKWSVLTREFVTSEKCVTGLKCVQVDEKLKPVLGSEFEIPTDMVIIAAGFIGHEPVKGIDPEAKGVFTAGDMRRGPSLVVWAFYEGREAACRINEYLEREGKNG